MVIESYRGAVRAIRKHGVTIPLYIFSIRRQPTPKAPPVAEGLPPDPKKSGHVYCAACAQSLSAGRVAQHLRAQTHHKKAAAHAARLALEARRAAAAAAKAK